MSQGEQIRELRSAVKALVHRLEVCSRRLRASPSSEGNGAVDYRAISQGWAALRASEAKCGAAGKDASAPSADAARRFVCRSCGQQGEPWTPGAHVCESCWDTWERERDGVLERAAGGGGAPIEFATGDRSAVDLNTSHCIKAPAEAGSPPCRGPSPKSGARCIEFPWPRWNVATNPRAPAGFCIVRPALIA